MSCSNCSLCSLAANCGTAVSASDSVPAVQSARIALIGNPNCGKTSLYNALTGKYEHVGNFPGITVELKTGNICLHGQKHQLVDLPGVYSLSAFSRDEQVTRDFLRDYKPDLIINVLDAANLERNLYLTAELSEMDIPVIAALNMVDVAERVGFRIDVRALSERLHVPVVAVVASKNRGIGTLTDAIHEAIHHPVRLAPYAPPHEIEKDFTALETVLESVKADLPMTSVRRCASLLAEGDRDAERVFETLANPRSAEIKAAVQKLKTNLLAHSGETGDAAIAEARYAYANGLVRACTQYVKPGKRHFSERLDDWICHRYLGIFLMIGAVYLLFTAVFAFSEEFTWIPGGLDGTFITPKEGVENLFAALGGFAGNHIQIPWLHSLTVDGVIGGIGGVMSFVPMLFLMFIFIAFLEDSGYIARVSFMLDRVLRIFGLQGKSVLSLVMAGGLGPGCAVPGIMATRTLRDDKDRLITMMVTPMMTCGAKLPLILVLVGAFFTDHKQSVMLLLWFISWAVTLGAALILSKFVIRGESTPFVMELPVYHMPRPKGVLIHACNNTWLYIKKAWTIILLVNVILWALMYFPTNTNPDNTPAASTLTESYAGRIGQALEPVTRLCGFDWRDNIALIGGAAAKEVVLSTLVTAYGMDANEDDKASFSQNLTRSPDWSPLRAFSLIIFTMFYSPCAATLAVIRSETRSWKWLIFAALFPTVLAFLLSALIWNLG